MKKVFIDIISGILLLILFFLVEIAFLLIFGEQEDRFSSQMANAGSEFLLIALPAGVLSFIISILFKQTNGRDIFRRSIIWTVIIALVYMVIGVVNGTAGVIFRSTGMYLMLILVFAGPLLAGYIFKGRSR